MKYSNLIVSIYSVGVQIYRIMLNYHLLTETSELSLHFCDYHISEWTDARIARELDFREC
jgi:hypothetical protein